MTLSFNFLRHVMLVSLLSFPYLFFLERCFNLKENTINTGFPIFVLALGTHPLPMRQLCDIKIQHVLSS